MGLAASQARLLFITSRQNDVSAKMQRVSNDTMVLARDEDEVITKYNKMLNATKMELKDGVELSYDALMGSTAINNRGSMNIITNSDGKVVLSTSDLQRYGLTQESGNKGDLAKIYPSVEDFIKVAEPDAETQTAIINALRTVNGTDKTGGTGSTTELTNDDIERIATFKKSYGEYPATEKFVTIAEAMQKAGNGNYSAAKTYGTDRWCNIQNEIGNASMYQILNGQYSNQAGDGSIRLATEGDRRGVPKDMARDNIKVIGEQFKEKIMNAFGFKSGGTVDQKLSAYVNSLSALAHEWNDGLNKKVDGSASGADFKTFVYTSATSTGGSTDNDHMWLNVQNLLRDMLQTALASSMEDYNNALPNQSDMITIVQNSKGYTKADYEDKLRLLVGDTKFEAAKTYLAPTSTSSGSVNGTATNKQKAQCYQTLYNALNNYGWSAENTETIAENLKNGTYKLNGGSLTSNTDLYEEVADKDSQAKAESYWNTEMKKIQRKEKILDQELTKLQTEYSSLTTDYESVKSIISQNVSRSFTYCQNG